MRSLPRILAITAVAFTSGIIASPLLQHALSEAHAASVSTPAIYDLFSMQSTDLPTTSNPEMRSKPLVVTDNATIALQAGNAPKHYHAHADEIQYIVEGTGQMWVGNERREIKPGTLIVIPKGTPHSGTIVTSGPIKAISIKIPPQASDDVVLVN
ncbi:MAG: cupin [Herbaspirillum sp.]|jgi:mannose-6-phosphate isomerase-like protein (cupin superfamily)|nr:cupin [Herbaspirillum sp.]